MLQPFCVSYQKLLFRKHQKSWIRCLTSFAKWDRIYTSLCIISLNWIARKVSRCIIEAIEVNPSWRPLSRIDFKKITILHLASMGAILAFIFRVTSSIALTLYIIWLMMRLEVQGILLIDTSRAFCIMQHYLLVTNGLEVGMMSFILDGWEFRDNHLLDFEVRQTSFATSSTSVSR